MKVKDLPSDILKTFKKKLIQINMIKIAQVFFFNNLMHWKLLIHEN